MILRTSNRRLHSEFSVIQIFSYACLINQMDHFHPSGLIIPVTSGDTFAEMTRMTAQDERQSS